VIGWPTLEFHLLALLKANFTINHVRSGVVPRFAITDPALRACVLPKLNFSLFGDHFHSHYLLGYPADSAERQRSLYGIGSKSSKRGATSCGKRVDE
jgi:hypothetical protein